MLFHLFVACYHIDFRLLRVYPLILDTDVVEDGRDSPEAIIKSRSFVRSFTCPISCVLTDYYIIVRFWSGCCAAFSRVCPRGRGWRRLHPGHKKLFYILRVTATFIMTDKFTFIYENSRTLTDILRAYSRDEGWQHLDATPADCQ